MTDREAKLHWVSFAVMLALLVSGCGKSRVIVDIPTNKAVTINVLMDIPTQKARP